MKSELKLIQFRCNRKGHLFYYQGYVKYLSGASCPFCIHSRAEATGREYSALNERDPNAFPKGDKP